MRCAVCGENLDKPGEYCLVCDTQNCEAIYVDTDENTADIRFISEEKVHGSQRIDWNDAENIEQQRKIERNFIGRIVDITRRRKPDFLYLNVEPNRIRELRSQLQDIEIFTFKPEENPVEEIQTHMRTRGLETVEMNPMDKIGGSHSTVIGDREGQSILATVASSKFVKKVIPGPIDGGGNSGGGFRAEVTRADSSGNLRVLVKEGGTVQTIRVVTTASNRQEADSIATDIRNRIE